jgi:hypothetical protein
MFFLIRCAFWLGLVFSALPWDGEDVRADLTGGAAKVSAAVVEKAQSLCLQDPAACAQHAARIGKALGTGVSQNSLLPGDLAPAWKSGIPLPPRRSPS